MEVKTVEECFHYIRNGANIKQGVLKGGYPITRIETISNDKFNRDKMGYAGIVNLDKYYSYVLDDGDLLMSHINSIQYLGRTVLYERQKGEKIIHGMNLLRLKANCSLINPRFAKYYFHSHIFREQIGKISKKSVNQASFAISDLKGLKINLPELKEQEEIVNILDNVNKLIYLYKEQMQIFDILIKSRFVEMFGDPIHNEKGWEIGTVEDACDDIYGGGTPSKAHPEYYENGNIPWVSSKDMKTDVLYDSQIHINQLGVDNSTAKMVPVNSVIMVIRSGILKHTLPVAINYVPVTVNQDLKVFIPKKDVLTRFLAVQFKMHEKDILSGVRAVTADNIEFNSLKQRKIIIPPLRIQQQFFDFTKKVDKLKSTTQQSISELQLLFDSLMQKYFG